MIHDGAWAIARSLDAGEWQLEGGGYRLVHEATRSSLWVANGRFFLDLCDDMARDKHAFNLVEKFWLWPKVRRAIRASAFNKFLPKCTKSANANE